MLLPVLLPWPGPACGHPVLLLPLHGKAPGALSCKLFLRTIQPTHLHPCCRYDMLRLPHPWGAADSQARQTESGQFLFDRWAGPPVASLSTCKPPCLPPAQLSCLLLQQHGSRAEGRAGQGSPCLRCVMKHQHPPAHARPYQLYHNHSLPPACPPARRERNWRALEWLMWLNTRTEIVYKQAGGAEGCSDAGAFCPCAHSWRRTPAPACSSSCMLA